MDREEERRSLELENYRSFYRIKELHSWTKCPVVRYFSQTIPGVQRLYPGLLPRKRPNSLFLAFLTKFSSASFHRSSTLRPCAEDNYNCSTDETSELSKQSVHPFPIPGGLGRFGPAQPPAGPIKSAPSVRPCLQQKFSYFQP